jgi:hypothetical protein
VPGIPQVPPAGELAALRVRVAELETRLAERDGQLEAAQARLAVLAEQIEELRAAAGQGLVHVVEAAVLGQPVCQEAAGPVAAAPVRAPAGQAAGHFVLDAAPVRSS